MFLRKLLVAVLPLFICFLLGVLFPFIGELFPDLGFFQNVLKGLLLGLALALLIPLAGGRRRESFSGLFFIPAALLLLTVIYQYLHQSGAWQAAFLSFFAMANGQVVFVECAFISFLFTIAVRASRK